MANDCRGQIQACAMRIARLDGAGVPQPGSNNSYTTNALISLAYTAEIATGEEVEVKNACGEVCLSYKDCDRLKRLSIEISLCAPDPELTEILVGGSTLSYALAGSTEVGYAFPSLNATSCPQGVSIEVWAKRITSGGAADSNAPYAWWVFPRTYLQHNSATFENGPFQPSISGFAIENENWFNGPAEDWPVDALRVAQWVPTNTIPTPTCGYGSVTAS